MAGEGLGKVDNEYHGAALRIAIVHARWNKSVIDSLVTGATEKLLSYGVQKLNIFIHSVPGSFELPYATESILRNTDVDAIISIGVLIKGDTAHFEYIADSATKELMRVQFRTDTPVIFGVLTCFDIEQAELRAGLHPDKKGNHNHGEDWASAAVEMAIKYNFANGKVPSIAQL